MYVIMQIIYRHAGCPCIECRWTSNNTIISFFPHYMGYHFTCQSRIINSYYLEHVRSYVTEHTKIYGSTVPSYGGEEDINYIHTSLAIAHASLCVCKTIQACTHLHAETLHSISIVVANRLITQFFV